MSANLTIILFILAPNGKLHLIEPSLIWYRPDDDDDDDFNIYKDSDCQYQESNSNTFSFIDEYNEILGRSLIQKGGYIPK